MARATILASLLVGCATSHETQGVMFDRRAERAAIVLAKGADADSLAAAGLLFLVTHRDRSLPLLEQATAIAPERADLVWLQSQVCLEVNPCDPHAKERRLQILDPSNGAGWLGALARARDDTTRNAALAAIGHSDRVDIYWTTLIARLTSATVQTKAISLPEAEVSIIGILAAQAIPSYRVVSESCKGERLQRADTLALCRGVAEAFERGDTYITANIGAAIAMRSWPENSPEWKAANEVRRVFDFRLKAFEKLDANLWDAKTAKNFLALCVQNHREQDVWRERLIEAGENPDPPTT